MLCSIFYKDVFVLHLSFIFSFILHPSWIIFYPYSYILFFPFFPLIHLSIRDKKGESILVCIIISIWLVDIRGGRKPLERCIHQGGEDIFFEKTLFCFVLLYACFLIVLWCFKLYLVSMLCCSHRIVFMCWKCIYSYVIVLYWLHIRIIICFAIWSL